MKMVGKPWEGLGRVHLRELSTNGREYLGEKKLKGEHLVELSEILLERNRWLLEDDIEEGEWMENRGEKQFTPPPKRGVGEGSAIRFIVKSSFRYNWVYVVRLSDKDLSSRDWKFARLMKQSEIQFTERNLMKIVGDLGSLGSWRQAMSVVEWVYSRDEYKHRKSRFVYTKLLAVLGKARRSSEALHIFNLMQLALNVEKIQEDCHIYPDMAAYHSIAVTLGQAGLVRELMTIIENMKRKPSKRVKNMARRDWDPCIEPDVVVFNAVLNACVPSHQWKGVSWVFQQMRKSCLKPNGATFGLAMEVMLQSGKYDLVHMFFEKMRRTGIALTALTYKVLVRSFWEEGKMNEAVEAVRDMERRGVVGTASVYYELACCLCKDGRWQKALAENRDKMFVAEQCSKRFVLLLPLDYVPHVRGNILDVDRFLVWTAGIGVTVEKLKKLPLTKPLEVAFTGMIMSCMDGGHVDGCISIFKHMNEHCSPNIGAINAMLKVYGRNDMFTKAKELFEETTKMDMAEQAYLVPDAYTYSSMLEASAVAHQWDYVEYVYKEMTLRGYQIDQKKHAWIVVEASRHGKGHLVEHAFDLTLEAGEIPHPSFFIEMVCQAVAEYNYKRATNLVNSMACASFQVSESQWTDALTRSRDRINRDALSKLLNIIQKDVVMEANAASFIKSLESLCGLNHQYGFSGFTALPTVKAEKLTADDNWGMLSSKIKVHSSEKVEGNSSIAMESSNDYGATFESRSANDSSNDLDIRLVDSNEDTDTDMRWHFGYTNDNEASNLSTVSVDDSNVKSLSLQNSQDSDLEETLNSLMGQDGNAGVPSASEILEAWKESRHKDGIFFPFQTMRNCN
ncbi:hypothetical protein Sjap_017817 [Stephania japonica]|uniref:Pentatricopeptide repeat-containing protein n=1 Tax=Stephania japonica TaxID=461633 RepID=A0AAP0I6V2_9MAGN